MMRLLLHINKNPDKRKPLVHLAAVTFEFTIPKINKIFIYIEVLFATLLTVHIDPWCSQFMKPFQCIAEYEINARLKKYKSIKQHIKKD